MQPFARACESLWGQACIVARLAIAVFASGWSRGHGCPFVLLLTAREARGMAMATRTLLSYNKEIMTRRDKLIRELLIARSSPWGGCRGSPADVQYHAVASKAALLHSRRALCPCTTSPPLSEPASPPSQDHGGLSALLLPGVPAGRDGGRGGSLPLVPPAPSSAELAAASSWQTPSSLN